jgi:hypothetical protein
MTLDQEPVYTCGTLSLSLDPAFAVNWCGGDWYLREQLRNELAGRIRVGAEFLEQFRRGCLRLWHVLSIGTNAPHPRYRNWASARRGIRISEYITI